MTTNESQDVALMRRVESISSGVFDNQRAIERNHKQNRTEHDEIMALLKEIHEATFGNGKPEHGLRYRIAWQERWTRFITLGVIVNSILNLIIVLIIAYHLVT